jgi:hypothetical protein
LGEVTQRGSPTGRRWLTQATTLDTAAAYNLIHVKIEALRPADQERFTKLYELLTRAEPHGEEGSIRASIRERSDTEATRCAEEVVGIYDSVAGDEDPF